MKVYHTELPLELKKIIRHKIFRRVVVCLFFLIPIGIALALWENALFETDNQVFKSACYIGMLVVPFVISGIPFKLIDKSFRGKIDKVDIETTVDNSSSAKPTREHLYVKNTIYLSIKREDGKVIRKKAYEGRAKLQQHLETYREGDDVFHLYGTKHIVVLPKKVNTYVQCSVCGDCNVKENELCRNCMSPLIKK